MATRKQAASAAPKRKRADRQRGVSDQTQRKPKRRPRGKPFEPGNKIGNRFQPGQSGNPGGRPKLLSDAYREWLASVNPNDQQGRTNAQLIAVGQGAAAIGGQTQAAREIRQATEGDTLWAGWQREIIDHLLAGTLTPEEVLEDLGEDDGRKLIVAAGASVAEGAPAAKE